MDLKPKETLDFAKLLAKEAASLIGSLGARVPTRRKADLTVVTEIDVAVQDQLLARIAQNCPEHAVIAEEAVQRLKAHADLESARYCWVIDPIDGTRNYAAGFPCFATSIALLDRGEPVCGVIAEHNLGRVYAATKGGGATMNDLPIRALDPSPGDDWLVGMASSKDALSMHVVQRWSQARGLVLRNTGSTAMHLALVASGALAGSFCKQCKIWDIAAGVLLVTEAGGVVTDPSGSPLTPFSLSLDVSTDLPTLATAPGTHQELLDSIRAGRPTNS